MSTESQRVTRSDDGRWMIHAHAKLNLGLRIFPARPDGFHDLETWMVPTSWYDTLWVDPNSPSLQLEITGRSQGVPTELDKNLVGKAALKLAAAAGIQPHGKITLHKVLSPGGGIGGGSSDAAAVLVALNDAWNLHWEAPRLEALAAQLGSDIPFFVPCRPSLCTGRGEIMTPLPLAQPLHAVLVIPPQGCPTKDVYQAFDAGHQHRPARTKTDWQRCALADAAELDALLVNDLEPAAFAVAPWLAELRRQTAAVLGQPVHMTGSGSTLFALCGSGARAGEMHSLLASALPCPSVPVSILRERGRSVSSEPRP
jgi:4-diphosphocytidyl-2-C-methyl-D-erythritol kinase